MNDKTRFDVEVRTTADLHDALMMLHEYGLSCADAAESITIRSSREPSTAATECAPRERKPAAAVASKPSSQSLDEIAADVYAKRRAQAIDSE